MSSDKSEYISNWLYRANEDISVIKSLVKSGTECYTSSICFHAQQACEKFLKAYLAYNDIDFPKTHDVDYLLENCKEVNKEAFGIDVKSVSLLDSHN